MTKSRTAPLLPLALVAAFPASVAAQPATAEALADAQRTELRTTLRLDCPPATDEEEIVVCGGRDDERHRLPLPTLPDRSAAANRAGGEQRAAMAANDARCTPVGRDQQCTGGLSVLGIGAFIVRAVTQALANRD